MSKLIFAGTPDFALASLEALVESGRAPVAVLTQPDRPAGRGKKLRASPVKDYALERDIPVLQPETLRDDAIVAELVGITPDLLVVAAYGLILPQRVLDIPRHGCLNVHASVLPRWRGAAPIQAAILAGDSTTGISLMQMEAGLDSGPVFHIETLDIGDDETAGELHDRLAVLGGAALVEKIDDIIAGNVEARPQDESHVTYAPKIEKHDAEVDWSIGAGEAARRVRAYNPFPGAYFFARRREQAPSHNGAGRRQAASHGDPVRIKIWRAEVTEQQGSSRTVLQADRDAIVVACGEGSLRLDELQLPGKRRVPAAEFAGQFDLAAHTLDEDPYMASAGARSRAVTAQVVDAVVSDGMSLDAAIARYEDQVPPADRGLLRMLAYGTLRHYWRLQEWIGELVNRPLRQRDSVINALLAIGLYQLSDTRIPDHAAVSQTVEAVRQLRRPKLAGLVNACLRRFQREDLKSRAPASDESRCNHPAWLIEALRRDWPDDAEHILAANNERAPMWLRVNSLRGTPADYRGRLAAAGIESELLEGVPDALRLSEPQDVDELPGFEDGAVSVQDAAAQIAARWLMRERPRRVLDACAAPGGKSGHLLELGGPDIELTALDSDARRLERVRDNHTRIGADATIVRGDASKPEEWWDGRPFDAILLDAPCSATGVIRRHPDIKLLRRATDIKALSDLQGEILKALWPLLAPGGRLLYVTCSVLAAENDDVLQVFLEAHSDAVEDTVLPNNNIRDLMRRKACGYQILPGTAGLDGFYFACLVSRPQA